MLVNTLQTWEDGNSKQEIIVETSFLMKDVSRIAQYPDYIDITWKDTREKTLIRFADGSEIIIICPYNLFHAKWTAFYQSPQKFTFDVLHLQ